MISRPAAAARYVLEHEGRRYEIESESLGLIGDRAVLHADGERVAEAKGELEPAVLEHDGLKIKVRWTLRHEIKEIRAESGDLPLRFVPPPGTLLARRDRWERDRPVLFAARHVAVAVGQILLGILGIGAIIQLILKPLLERLPHPGWHLPDLHLPKIDLPDLPFPDLDLPDWEPPGWLAAVLHTARYWGPILVAVGVALNEIDKNRKKHARDGADPAGGDNGAGDPPADPK